MRSARLEAFLEARAPLLFAHRGYSRRAPENTLAAFREARSAGVPGVELDVQRCRSGELVVVHDFDLARVTGVRRAVADADYADIRTLDAGSWFAPRFSRERIPRLGAVFDELADSVYYDVEIKARGRDCRAIARGVVDEIVGHGLTRRALVSSFNPFAILAAKRIAPEIPTAIIYSGDRDLPYFARHGEARFLGRWSAVKPSRRKVTRIGVFVNRRMLGYPVIAWTVDDVALARELLDRGASGLVSNDPAPILRLPQFARAR